MLSTSEAYGLVPFAALSIVYWWRDRYFFNRARGISPVQWQVLVFFYPLWSYMEWTSSLQISRGNWHYIAVSTIGRTFLGHYTTVAIFNDAFVQTRQQALSFFVSLFINYMWTVVNVLMFSNNSNQVHCVGHQNATNG